MIRLQRAFTLIELLVVIAIIAILAAILFPVFASAREKARQTACMSNCRQMGAAIHMYSDDNQGFFPLDSHSSGYSSWQVGIFPYMKSKDVLRCPSDTSANFDKPLPGYTLKRQTSYGTSYYMSPLEPGETEAKTHGFNRWSKINSPSNTIYISEIKMNETADHYHPAWWFVPNPDGGSNYITGNNGIGGPYEEVACGAPNPMFKDKIKPCFYHQGRPNYVFLDGHTQALAFDQTFLWSGASAPPTTDLYNPAH